MSSRVKELETSRTVSHAASRGTLFVVSSPSGGGKGTIIRHVLEVAEILAILSHTRLARHVTVKSMAASISL